MEDFIEFFTKDTRFLAFMKCCLDIGNLINIGTRRGSAYGFKFQSFKSFASCKSNNGKVYLLPYIIEKIALSKDHAQILDFYKDMTACITGAMTFDMDDVITNIGTLKSKLGKLKNLLESVEKMKIKDKDGEKEDPFKEKFSEFFSLNLSPVIEIEEKSQKTKELFLETCVKMGDEMKKIKGEKSSVIVGEYKKVLVEFSRSIDDIMKSVAKQKKKDQRTEKKKKLGASDNID